jgi:hypothetical protein
MMGDCGTIDAGSLSCEQTVQTGNAFLLKLSSKSLCKSNLEVLNKMLVDITRFDNENTGSLQCSPSGFIKHSQDHKDQCSASIEALNIAIKQHQTGEYRACDYSTITSTATNSYGSTVTTTATTTASASQSSTVTSTVTSRLYAKMACALHDGTTYLYPESDCARQIKTLEDILQKCDASFEGNLMCGWVGDDQFIGSEEVTDCPAAATAINKAVDSVMFPRGYNAGVSCSIDGYLMIQKGNCEKVATYLNDAMDRFVYGDFHECY